MKIIPVTINNYEEWFLLYADGELDETQQQQLKKFLSANPGLKHELQLLMDTVMRPDDMITFEHKAALYKKGSGNRLLMTWVRAAAAVLLLMAGMGWWYYTRQDTTVKSGLAIDGTPVIKAPIILPPAKTGVPEVADVAPVTTAEEKKQEQIPAFVKDIPQQEQQAVQQEQSITQPGENINPVQEIHAANTPGPETDKPAPVTNNGRDGQLPVAATQTVKPVYATATTVKPEQKKGLFRKLSERIKEKAIDVLADDDETVHVGVFAINVR